ncbi:MAG: hypothetical protein LBT00_04005, partial [Spirochaetaceae bacterium]|nr:hypothetical protein [Spirochaetaceae bacterium]
MKRMVLVIAILAAGIPVFAQTTGLREFDFFGGQGGNPRGIDFALDGKGLLVSGSHSDASGYMVNADEDLELSGKRRLIITISGITENDAFDMSKLLKLELNDEPQITVSPGM